MIGERISALRQFSIETLVRPAIVLGVLGLAAYLAYSGNAQWVVLLSGLVLCLVLMHNLSLGFVILLVAGLSIPFAVGTGSQTELNVAALLIPLLCGVWILQMVVRGELRLAPSRVNLPLFALTASVTLSLLLGNLTWNFFAEPVRFSVQIGGWAIFILSFGVFLCAANRIQVRWLEWLVFSFCLIGAVVVAGRIFAPFAGLALKLIAPGSTGSLFWLWIAALAGGQLLFNRSLHWGIRFALAALIFGTFWALWVLDRSWASGWLPAGLCLFLLVLFRSWRIGILVLLLGALFLFMRQPDFVSRLIAADQYSLDTRLIAWQIILTDVIRPDPLFGLGPANYREYTQLYPILGWYVKFNSHNQFVDLAAQIGLIGLGLFFWLMVSIWRVGWSLRKRVGNGFKRGYVYGCLAGLVGTLAAGMLADWFLPFVYNIGFAGFRASMLGWLFLGGLVSLEHMQYGRADD